MYRVNPTQTNKGWWTRYSPPHNSDDLIRQPSADFEYWIVYVLLIVIAKYSILMFNIIEYSTHFKIVCHS